MEPQSCPSEIGQPNNSVQTNHFKVKPMQICAFPMGHYRQTHKNTHIFFRGTFRGQEAFGFDPSG